MRQRAAMILGATALVSAAVWLPMVGGSAVAPAAVAVAPPNSIDTTGRQDVTDALNAFLAELPPGATVTFPRGARYRVEGVLLLTNRRNVTIEGNGATFFATTDGSGVQPPRRGFRSRWPRRREQWDIRGGRDIRLHDITVQGANPHGGATEGAFVPSLEGQAGIGISRASGVVLDAVTVTDTYGDFVWITGGATNVTIRQSTFARSGRQGVAIVNAQQVLVEDNDIRDVARSVFDLEPLGRALVSNVHLRQNRVGDYTNFLLAAGGGGPGVNDIWLEGNRVDGGNGVSVFAGLAAQRRHGYHVLDNTGTGAARPPAHPGASGLFQLQNLDGVEVRGNRQRVDGVPALSLDRVCDLTLADNQFTGASRQQEVVAPCGAARTAPTTRAGPTTPSRTAPADRDRDAAAEPGDDQDDTTLLLAGVAGFALGIAVAGVAAFVWYRRRDRHTAP